MKVLPFILILACAAADVGTTVIGFRVGAHEYGLFAWYFIDLFGRFWLSGWPIAVFLSESIAASLMAVVILRLARRFKVSEKWVYVAPLGMLPILVGNLISMAFAAAQL